MRGKPHTLTHVVMHVVQHAFWDNQFLLELAHRAQGASSHPLCSLLRSIHMAVECSAKNFLAAWARKFPWHTLHTTQRITKNVVACYVSGGKIRKGQAMCKAVSANVFHIP